jgi:diacylglycerol kinase
MIKLLNSFGYAFKGIAVFFAKDRNGQIQGVIAIAAIILGVACHISITEWLFVITCIGAVISLEMLNTAIEKICDTVFPDFHTQVKMIKDVAAGAVVIMAFTSLAIGFIIFIPKIF